MPLEDWPEAGVLLVPGKPCTGLRRTASRRRATAPLTTGHLQSLTMKCRPHIHMRPSTASVINETRIPATRAGGLGACGGRRRPGGGLAGPVRTDL